jgi:hypothetical protein
MTATKLRGGLPLKGAGRYITHCVVARFRQMNEKNEWLKAGGVTVDSSAVLIELKVGDADDLLQRLILRKIAAARAMREGLSVLPADLGKALTAFYTEHNLFEKEQIGEWHRTLPIDEAALREFLRERILHQRLGAKLITDDAVAERFSTNPHEYARAEVNVFTFVTAGAAREFILAVEEKEVAPFGESKWVVRRKAPEEIAAELFSGQPGNMFGPVETEDRHHAVYRLVHREEAKLDNALKEQLRGEMLTDLLKAELSRQPRAFLV